MPGKLAVKGLPAAKRRDGTAGSALDSELSRRHNARREEDGPAALAGAVAERGVTARAACGRWPGQAALRQWPAPVRGCAGGAGQGAAHQRRESPVHATANGAAPPLGHAFPAPCTAQLYHGGQEVRLGFPGSRDTFATLAWWAERFGGTVTGEPYTSDDGRESVHCQVRFPYQGVTVEAYAFITAEEASTT